MARNSLISVIMPFRNAAETIGAALEGLLAQSDLSIEVIAIDDGSSDSGQTVVRRWMARDHRVRLVHGAGDGLVSALTRGIAEARGEWLARMDADDLTHPTRLQKQREFLNAHERVGAVGTLVSPFADDGPVGEGLARYVAWQNGLVTPEQHRRELFVESPLCHPSVMMRRAALERVGGYRETGGPEDYDLWLRLAAAGFALAKVPQVLLSWRHRAGRATFADPRYTLERFREAKAPFLAARIREANAARRVLWGAGPTGRRLARELERHGVRFDLFIDIDPDKIGRTARGAPITSPDALDPATDVVVAAVGARGARELIRPDLTRRGFVEGESFWFGS